VPFGNRDQVKVILDSGVQEITTMDRGIEFKLVDVFPAPVVPVSTVP
jgi:hypothetical protein